MPQNEARPHGVYAEEESGTVVLLRVEPTADSAMRFLGAYALYSAFGTIPEESLLRLATALNTALEQKSFYKAFSVMGRVYYIEELSVTSLGE